MVIVATGAEPATDRRIPKGQEKEKEKHVWIGVRNEIEKAHFRVGPALMNNLEFHDHPRFPLSACKRNKNKTSHVRPRSRTCLRPFALLYAWTLSFFEGQAHKTRKIYYSSFQRHQLLVLIIFHYTILSLFVLAFWSCRSFRSIFIKE